MPKNYWWFLIVWLSFMEGSLYCSLMRIVDSLLGTRVTRTTTKFFSVTFYSQVPPGDRKDTEYTKLSKDNI